MLTPGHALAPSGCARLKARGDFRASVLRGANSSGDSDSIACIAGSIAGALGGYECLPPEWVRDVEKGARLDELACLLHAVAVGAADVAEPPESLDFFRAEGGVP